jgi:tetratricopeptide (TPR) repeat protein
VNRVIQVFCLTMLSVISSQAISSSTSETAQLLAQGAWKVAVQKIFADARTLNRHESAIALGQIRAGLTDDALVTINETHAVNRVWLISELIRKSPALPDETRSQLFQQAVQIAHANAYADLAAGDFTKLALLSVKEGNIEAGKTLFTEAILAAQKGQGEDSAGLRRITEELTRAPLLELKGWMLAALIAVLPSSSEDKLAFPCVDLLSVAGRLEEPKYFPVLVDCAQRGIANISREGVQDYASAALADVKFELGLLGEARSLPPRLNAKIAVRNGQFLQAQAMIHDMPQGLYVDLVQDTYLAVIHDAFQRGDLAAAEFFIRRPVRDLPAVQLANWQTLARHHLQMGQVQLSDDSNAKAIDVLPRLSAAQRIYGRNVKIVAHLAIALQRQGRIEQARQVIQVAQTLLVRIPDRQVDDQIEAQLSVAAALWWTDQRPAACEGFLKAYLKAQQMPEDSSSADSRKARQLSTVGNAIVDLI